MIKSLYSAYSGMEAAWRYQEVLANNIANASTVGYKREVGVQQSFDDVLLSQQAATPAPIPARIDAIIGQIGTGTFMAEFSTDYTDGSLQRTGRELDLALEDGFFAIQGPDGQRFLTRDGRFGRDVDGSLVTAHGYYVLDDAGQPITLPEGPVSVSPQGAITGSDGQAVANLQVRDFTPAQLQRAGEGYFISDADGVLVEGNVRQGILEGSNTELAEELTAMLAVNRVYQANQTILSQTDQTLEQATTQLASFGG